ncbi:DUF6350 family protein [Gardnerella sp. Marseille-Q9185]|uniref:cell division protein PerM n=1 Tax=Gardnerella sp. Marseille-Q9185 TaxID=3390094 RepID=UPI003970C63E
MVEKLKSSLISVSKGVITPFIVIFVFSLTIGLFLSLTLLIVSIEEGTGNLSDSAMSMTWAVFMFAQGIGLTFDNCVLTITPLGLTILLIASLSSLIRKVEGGSTAYVTGTVFWVAINVILSQNTHITLVDSVPVIIFKTALIYLISLFIAVFPRSLVYKTLKQRYKQMCPEFAQKNIRIIKRSSVILFAIYSAVALVTVIVWCCTNIGSVNSFFIKLGMQNGSRILTSIACLVWLPNIAIWALSWICGAGFSIGKVAHFTLASSMHKSLPPVPVFGIFPESVSDSLYRNAILSIIPIICFAVILLAILHKRGCGLRLKNIKDKEELKAFAISLAQAAAVSICIASLITVIFTIVFALANGSLGEYRLSFVGVDIVESTRAVGHLTLYAVCAAWLIAALGILLSCAIRYLFSMLLNKNFAQNKTLTVETETTSDPAEDNTNKTDTELIQRKSPLSLKKAAPRTVSSKTKIK